MCFHSETCSEDDNFTFFYRSTFSDSFYLTDYSILQSNKAQELLGSFSFVKAFNEAIQNLKILLQNHGIQWKDLLFLKIYYDSNKLSPYVFSKGKQKIYFFSIVFKNILCSFFQSM